MQHTPFKFLPQDRTPVPEFVTLYAPFWRDALPNGTWSWNPWTGIPRAPGDKESDPLGKLIVPPGEKVEAGRPTVYGVPLDDYVDWHRRNLPSNLGPSDEAYMAVQYAGAQTVKVVQALRARDIEAAAPQSDVPNSPPLAPDTVNHPPHYTAGGVECIDAIAAATTGLEGIEAACTANAIKYLWRWKRKNGLEDLRKARWYINHLLGEN